MIRAGFRPADWVTEHTKFGTQYRCRTCRCHYADRERHNPGGRKCLEARDERIASQRD